MFSGPSKVKLYFKNLAFLINNHPFVQNYNVIKERISIDEGFSQISIRLVNDFRFEVFEYYDSIKGVTKYRYQLLDTKDSLVSRWDNSSHHKQVNTFPHHVHTTSGVEPYQPKPLIELIDDLDKFW